MTEQQAQQQAATIKEQFPHVETSVIAALDTRNAPRHWFVEVSRRDEKHGVSLHIHNKQEWIEALEAWYVLR